MSELRLDGRVMQLLPRGGVVAHEERMIRCEFRGVRRLSHRDSRHPVAVGDSVRISLVSEDEGVIEEVGERTSSFSRKSPGDGGEHVLAANSDAAMAIISTEKTLFRPGLADRILGGAVLGGLAGWVCLNKVDLPPHPEAEGTLAGYARAGFEVFRTSAVTGEGLDELRASLSGKTVVVVGHSGVGKSSLLTRLWPELDLRVGDLSRKTRRGMHTTTSPRMYRTAGSGFVIDTPGIREFEPYGVTRRNLWACFPEMADFGSSCRFHDCLHLDEPGCTVKKAVEENALDAGRYERYLRLLESLQD